MDQDLLSFLPRRSDQDADDVHGRPIGFQRADHWRRADVSGAADARRRDAAHHLSVAVSRSDDSQLSQGSPRSLAGMVRQASQAWLDDDERGQAMMPAMRA